MLAIAFVVTGCGSAGPVDNEAARAAEALPDVNARAPTAIGEPHNATEPAESIPAAAIPIPAALQGRWGLSPADCLAGRSDTKGLLIVTPSDLRFYESRAVPSADTQSGPSSISGHFAFTGEGQSWTKYEALKIDKQVLVRTEANPTASFSYAKCG